MNIFEFQFRADCKPKHNNCYVVHLFLMLRKSGIHKILGNRNIKHIINCIKYHHFPYQVCKKNTAIAIDDTCINKQWNKK